MSISHFFFLMNDENDENRMMTKKAENFLRVSNPGHWASFSVERTHNELAIRDVYKLNFVKVSTTNQTKPAQSTAKRVQSCRCEVCAVRCGRCAAGWLSVRAARRTVCGLFAMRCAARRAGSFLRCTGCDATSPRAAMHGMRCNALRAGWLHSRGAGGTMLLTEGF